MEVNEQIAIDHGLKKDEYKKICDLLKRTPNLTELGIFSAMWNEHCSYKSSRLHLKKLPTSGEKVIQGPGENAGVIDIDDGDAIVFKIESHNHPSFIEPYQGAATGVGGIMRDVFTMGARPIANLNSIHFGSPQHKKTKNLVLPLMRRIDNSDIIEHAAIVRALDLRNLQDKKIGPEIAKYLQQRLNLISNISEKTWKVIHENNTIKLERTIRGFTEKFVIDENFVVTPEPKSLKIEENRRKINGKSMKIDENPEGRRAGQVISGREQREITENQGK